MYGIVVRKVHFDILQKDGTQSGFVLLCVYLIFVSTAVANAYVQRCN
jgi:hypothetical protein